VPVHLDLNFCPAGIADRCVTAPSFQQVQPVPRRQRGLGCGAIVLLVVGILFFAVLGITGGLVCYGLAWGFGTRSIGVSIAAGALALVIVYLCTPFGFGLGVLLFPDNHHPVIKSAGALLAAVLGPIFLCTEVLFLAVPAAIAAGLMFHWCQPLLASILLAVLSPLAGLGIGYVLFGHTGGDSNGGGGSSWGDGGWGDGGGDGGDGGGE
jgi:hypothetical protein